MMKFKISKDDYKACMGWLKYLILAAGINLIIESASRHSIKEGINYLLDTPLTFLYNTLVIGICYLAVYLVRRKVFACAAVSMLWLAAGIANGVVLTNRVTPLTGSDFGMIKDVFSIIELYMTLPEIIVCVAGAVTAIGLLVLLYRRSPRAEGEIHWKKRLLVLAGAAVLFLGATRTAIEFRIVDTYFSNIAYAYEDYGFPYCFVTSVLDTGMDRPFHYSENTIGSILDKCEQETVPAAEGGHQPNIIFVQLETFFDATLLNGIELSEDPIPNFRKYMEDYSSGYFRVPVIGAGTANTEFETITGMSLRYFGPGEYPYKTVMKDTACDSMAYALKRIGYTAHALHNNNATFYGRNKVFANLGFDTFTSVEMMSGVEYNEMNWADDSVLTPYIMDCLSSSEGPDYVYAISVQGHGSYPKEPVLEDPKIRVTKAETEEKRNQYEYYVNQLYEMDQFVKELITAVEALEEDTMVVMYGDHLPTMGLNGNDIKDGTLYSTSYFIWDNLGLQKEDKNIAAYQMGAEVTDRINIHEGIMMQYHQKRLGTRYYMPDMELLQYDMLYGAGYAYRSIAHPVSTDLILGVRELAVTDVDTHVEDRVFVYGVNFNEYSVIAVNGKELETRRIGDWLFIAKDVVLKEGDAVTVQQIDKEGVLLRETEPYLIE